MINLPPRGLIVDLVTPLDEEGRPDGEALRRLFDRLRGEADGVLIGSVTVGEAFALGRDDRLAILRAALDSGPESMPIIFEVTSRNEEETLDLVGATEAALARRPIKREIFLLIKPLAYRGNRGLPDHLTDLGRRTNRPVLLGNDPDLVGRLRTGRQHRNIRTNVLKKSVGHEQVVGLVFAGEMDRALNYQRAVRSRAQFRFFDGNEVDFLERPSSSGLISCGANLVPRPWADIVKSSLNIYDTRRLRPDHLNYVWQAAQQVRTLRDAYQGHPAALIKAALHQMDIIPRSRIASSTPAPTDSDRLRLEQVLRDLNLI